MSNPAENYENYVVPSLFAPWADIVIEKLAPAPDEQVLDVACGTGIVARKVAPLLGVGGGVVGVDPSAGMLEVARSAASKESVEVEWHEGKGESLPLPDGSFDAVTCQQGVQFFTDRPAGLGEMFRVLEDGGRCVISLWQGMEKHTFFQALDRSLQAHFNAGAARVPFSLGQADELERLLEEAGFDQITIEQRSMDAVYPDPERFLMETLRGLSAVVPALQDPNAAGEALAKLREDMAGPMREATRGNEVVLSWHANIATAVRPAA